MYPETSATVWYLAMDAPGRLVQAPPSEAAIGVEDDPLLGRRLYEEIGADFDWIDRLGHDNDWWRDLYGGRTLLVARVRHEPAGYAELAACPGGEIDIAYFGIREAFRGRGIGGHLLSDAVRRAWDAGATRVTVNTCSLDGEAALPNYRRRGFDVIRTATETRRTFPR